MTKLSRRYRSPNHSLLISCEAANVRTKITISQVPLSQLLAKRKERFFLDTVVYYLTYHILKLQDFPIYLHRN